MKDEPKHFDQADKSCYDHGCTDDCPVALENNCTVGAGVPSRHADEPVPNIRKPFWRNVAEFFWRFR